MRPQGKRMVLLVTLVAIIMAAASLTILVLSQRAPSMGPLEPEVRISYAPTYTDTIAGSIKPPAGRTFLIIHLIVENRGYSHFNADPFRDMYVTVGLQTHNVSATMYFLLDNPFDPTDLEDGGTVSGDVSFEVSEGTTYFSPGWRLAPGAPLKLTWNRA